MIKWSLLALLILAPAGCSKSSEPTGLSGEEKKVQKTQRTSPKRGIKVIEVPYDVSSLSEYLAALNRKERAHQRQLVVYVGATWCAPCVLFMRAVKQGKLHKRFPRLTLAKLDYDRHRVGLEKAGYLSKYVPLFAIPGPDGRTGPKRFMGASRGEQGVTSIIERLNAMLTPVRE